MLRRVVAQGVSLRANTRRCDAAGSSAAKKTAVGVREEDARTN